MRNRLTLLASIAALGFSLAAHAQATITAAGPAFTEANGSTMLGSASNYDLFGWQGPNPSVLTDYTVTPLGTIANQGNVYAYSEIAAPGTATAYYTGILLIGSPLATFTTHSAGDFTVYILNANSDANTNLYDTSVGLSTNGGTEVDIASSAGNPYQRLQYSQFNITGATAGEVFNVYAHDDAPFPDIGGISFSDLGPSTSPVPEPSSFILLGTGVLSLAGAARRRFIKA